MLNTRTKLFLTVLLSVSEKLTFTSHYSFHTFLQAQRSVGQGGNLILLFPLRGGGRRAEKRMKPDKKIKSANKEDLEGNGNDGDGFTDQRVRHRRYFRRNRCTSSYNRDFRESIAEWEASWNDKTGYDLTGTGMKRQTPTDTSAAQWFESRKSLKKFKSLATNASATADEAEDARMQADVKRVQALLGIR